MVNLFEGALRKWQFTLGFTLFSLVFVLAEIAFQYYFVVPDSNIGSALIRGFGFSGATFFAAALLSSAIFKFHAPYAKYWTVRRALGVAGFLFIVLHVLSVLNFGLNWDIGIIFFLLDPFANPLLFGVLGVVILLPVALTSTDWAMAKLGGKWKAVQRLVYFSFWASVAHFMLINPPGLMNAAGYLLLLLTGLALLGELYWFVKISGQRNFRTLGTVIGLIIILLYLVAIYLAYFAPA